MDANKIERYVKSIERNMQSIERNVKTWQVAYRCTGYTTQAKCLSKDNTPLKLTKRATIDADARHGITRQVQ